MQATQPVNEHNLKAAATWSSGGRHYDEISRQIASAIEHCVDRLDPQPGARILDLATGTGWTSRRVAGRGALVTGVDIADGLLEAARGLAAEAGLSIDYRLGDAERLPFEDGAFDGVISTFGVMFAVDQEAAIGELARVCRRGGRIAVAAWRPGSTAATMFAALAPFMPPAPPSPSPFNWGDPDWLATTLGDSFEIGCETGTTVNRQADGEAMWALFTRGFGPVKGLAEGLDEGRRGELKRSLIAWFGQFDTPLGVSLPIDYLVTAGTRR